MIRSASIAAVLSAMLTSPAAPSPGGADAAASPEEVFARPPHEADVGVWWHWMGSAITEDGIVKDLDYFKAAGIGYATVFAISDTVVPQGMSVGLGPFKKTVAFTPEWFKLLKFACREARIRGIEIGLHNSPGYTSTGGPWIPARLSMRKLVFNAAGTKGGDVVEIANVGGVSIAHAPLGSRNNPAQPEATGLECDKMSAEAVSFHCDHVLGELRRHLGEEFGRGLTYIHLDSYEAGRATWTPKMREEFQVRKGYDCLPFLPSLGGFKTDRPDDAVAKFRRDFEDVLKDLYRDNLFKIMGEKIRAAGLRFTCEPYSGPFRIDDGVRAADIPMDESWFVRKPKAHPPVSWNRLEDSAGRRHNVVEVEAFTGLPQLTAWTERLDEIKAVGDVILQRGLNRFFLHSCPLQPFADDVRPGMTMGRWGSHFGRTQTWALPATNAWFAYQRRCQALLQWGRPADCALPVLDPLRTCARTDGVRTIHFVVNMSETNAVFAFEGRWFEPVSGSIGSVPRVLAPRQSGFYEAVEESLPPSLGASPGDILAELTGDWRLEFTGEGCLSKTGLFDWTTSKNKDVKYFSGTAIYSKSFDMDAMALGSDLLDLGETLGHVSEVRLNGRFLGTVWTAPWSVAVPRGLLKAKGNHLEIRYTNVWANRLVGDEQLCDDCAWKSAGAATGWFPDAWPAWSVVGIRNRPMKGRKAFCSWKHYTSDGQLVPSGLVGPVTFRAVRK